MPLAWFSIDTTSRGALERLVVLGDEILRSLEASTEAHCEIADGWWSICDCSVAHRLISISGPRHSRYASRYANRPSIRVQRQRPLVEFGSTWAGVVNSNSS